jgi:hypothetical protein
MRYLHTFVPIDDRSARVVDEVSLRLRSHLRWGLTGLIMWPSLPLLSAARSRKTQQLLERGGV